jgi:hypothetical protein
MNIEFKKSIKLCVIYLFVTIIFSAITIEVFVYGMPIEIKSMGRISALFSMSFTVIFKWIAIVLLLSINWFFTKQILVNIKDSNFFYGYINIVWVFILTECLKFSLVWIFLVDELRFLDFNSNDFKNQIESTTFGTISHISDLAAIILASLAFGYTLIANDEKVKTSILAAIFVLISLIVGQFT